MYGVHIDVFTDHKSLQYVFSQKDLNLHQRRWLELFKHYDMSVLYHLGKANILVDALSRMSMGSVAHVDDSKKKLTQEVHHLSRIGVRLVDIDEGDIWVQSSSELSLVFEVKEKQGRDPSLFKLKESVKDQKVEAFSKGGDSVLCCQGFLCVLCVDDLRQRILAKAHGA